MSDERPPVYFEGDTIVFRASSVGMSLKALVALLMGYEPADPTDRMLEIFEIGDKLEPVIIDKLRDVIRPAEVDEFDPETGEQFELEYNVTDDIIIRGHTDGRVVEGANKEPIAGVEAKSFGDSLWSAHRNGSLFTKEPYYRDQLTVYMSIWNLPFWYAVGRKGGPNGDEVVDFHAEYIEEPPNTIEAIEKKVLKAVELWELGELPKECNCGYFCPVFFLHEGDDRERVEGDLQKELDALASTYRKGKNMEDKGEKIKKVASKKIAELLDEHGIERGETDRVKVTQVSYEGTGIRKNDVIEFIEEHGGDVDEYIYSYPVKYPKITDRETEAA